MPSSHFFKTWFPFFRPMALLILRRQLKPIIVFGRVRDSTEIKFPRAIKMHLLKGLKFRQEATSGDELSILVFLSNESSVLGCFMNAVTAESWYPPETGKTT